MWRWRAREHGRSRSPPPGGLPERPSRASLVWGALTHLTWEGARGPPGGQAPTRDCPARTQGTGWGRGPGVAPCPGPFSCPSSPCPLRATQAAQPTIPLTRPPTRLFIPCFLGTACDQGLVQALGESVGTGRSPPGPTPVPGTGGGVRKQIRTGANRPGVQRAPEEEEGRTSGAWKEWRQERGPLRGGARGCVTPCAQRRGRGRKASRRACTGPA